MASKRSIPTTLFFSPDFFELSCNDTRLIMIGIILDADDEGRGSAHRTVLARKLHQEMELIDNALQELEQHGILQCYEVAGRPYYLLCHWHTYQTLSKPTPSKFPAPLAANQKGTPTTFQEDAGDAALLQGNVGQSRNTLGNSGTPTTPLGNPGQSRNTPLEGEEEREREREQEREGKRTEGEDEDAPHNILPFPAIGVGVSSSAHEHLEVATNKIAQTLQLPVTEALTQIVQEFLGTSTLSLVGEAIEAREWIDDPGRNHSHKQMSLAFFRRWLKRERGDYGQPVSWTQQATGTTGRRSGTRARDAPIANVGKDDPYREYVLRLSAEHLSQAAQEGHRG
jgi:hypothetical protein